ncbi:putative Undecaprenyl-phosphate galactose phosphotransferase RfbP [Candidatus Nitrospira nitrosa]|uniref:Putative Undecaprenyl-phosphate galactose phosphotransferase RfbP n=1 Tax=Candidatus Nitrospira nitrosa TaxID=1742972 RepID=A0A0S4LPB7_9BACT|nr:TIGR03013 family XrtA/PEP-CTERM system glycosyltransferase [Candidatus Nitrospira nitrosa]CUS38793.1 putative Undecaprenyl-phosphate galactose phosphotransferase RfbP [Candidatus Nitrospira nitrosa]
MMDAIVDTRPSAAPPRVTLHPVTAEELKSRRQVLILGQGEFALTCQQVLMSESRMAGRVIGFVNHSDSEPTGYPVLGTFADLPELVERYKVGLIVVCLDDQRATLPVDLLLDLKVAGIEVIDGHRLFEKVTGRLSIDSLRPSALIFSPGFKRHAATAAAKRVVDVMIASVSLLTMAPFLLIVAMLIKLDSPGPIFYRQKRVGFHSRPFMIIKFRSMVDGAETSGPRWAQENDHRVSRVGRWLRKARIDEIPQFINVLKGEMSVIGPRPERPIFVEELRTQIPYYDIRHTVRPGITGWAQVMFGYAASQEDSHLKFQYDLYYIKNRSFWLDLKTLGKTVRVLMKGEGAR